MHYVLGKRRQKMFHLNSHYSSSCSTFSSHTRKFLKPRIVPNETLRYCDWLFFHGRTWYPSSHPLKVIATKNFSGTTKCSQWNFSVMWDKKNRRKNVISTSLIHTNFSLRQFSWNTEEFPRKLFGILSRTKMTGKRDIPRRIPKYFRFQKFFETTKSSHRKFLKLWYRKFATEKHDIPLSFIQYSRCQNFCETPKCSQCTLSVKGDKKCLTEICITPVLFIYFFPF